MSSTSPFFDRIVAATGLNELIAAHRLWVEWLQEGRMRKLAFVAERRVCAEAR